MSDPVHLRSAVTMVMVKFSGGRNHQGFDAKPHAVMDGQFAMHVTEQVGGLLPGSTQCGLTPKWPSTSRLVRRALSTSDGADCSLHPPPGYLRFPSYPKLPTQVRWNLEVWELARRCSVFTLFENPPEHHTITGSLGHWPTGSRAPG